MRTKQSVPFLVSKCTVPCTLYKSRCFFVHLTILWISMTRVFCCPSSELHNQMLNSCRHELIWTTTTKSCHFIPSHFPSPLSLFRNLTLICIKRRGLPLDALITNWNPEPKFWKSPKIQELELDLYVRYVAVLQESIPFLWFALELNVDMPNQGIKKGIKKVFFLFLNGLGWRWWG